MYGILLLLAFLVLGLAISNRVFGERPIYVRAWVGLLVGLLGLMWLVVPFSLFIGFTKTSHLLALLAMVILYLIIRKLYAKEGCLKYQSDGSDVVMAAVTLPIFLLIAYLLNTHIIAPGNDGGLYVGQSTYGDLSLHLGIITSIAEQGIFPPEYSIFPGKILSYPFLADSLSSSLYLFGTPLRLAVLIPSFVMALTLVSGFFILANEILKNKFASAFSTLIFFFNGGFGFIYFMDGLAKDPSNFTRIFSAWYNTPTNYNEHFIRWSNVICDMIIPQRTSLAGWTFIILAIWLLYNAVNGENKRYFAYAGIVSGLMPMVHTHSFLAMGIISAAWFAVYFFQQQNKKEYILNWLDFGIPALLLSLPQLFYWTFPQSTGGDFVKLHFDWANEGDIWSWFWIKNVGLVFILLFPALLAARRKELSVYSGALLIFIIAEFVLFQPNTYDNNKLFYIWYIFTVILVSDFLWKVYKSMEGIRAKWSILVIALIFCTFSGALTVGREVKSSYMLFGPNEVEAAKFIKSNTPKDAMFITSDNHNNAVSSLTGRNVLSGTPIFLHFHGVGYQERAQDVEAMYKNPESFKTLSVKHNIDYVYFSSYEKGKFNIEPSFFLSNYPVVFQNGDIFIFAVSERAKNLYQSKTLK
ncbi:MAG: hypothetical protein N3B21_18715 [Clostridia bacterium]|nr:hypothetical protein [Clostridia bacterium]